VLLHLHECRIQQELLCGKCLYSPTVSRWCQHCDFSQIAARKTIFWHLRSPPLRLTSTCGRTDNSKIQGLASSCDNILIPAQDPTQRRGAATNQQEAGLNARGVTTITTGTRTSKLQDYNPQATQPTRRHKSCKSDEREHGHAHHPHPRRAQPASKTGPYDACKTTNAAATTWPGRNARANFRAHTLACMTPSLRGRTRASPLGPRT